MTAPRFHGLLAEFATADALLAAAGEASRRGFAVDAYSPFPIEGLAAAIGFRRNRMPLIAFAGGLAGGLGTYLLQWYSAVVDYPINAGGRPLDSWPAFVPPTLAVTILGAAIAVVAGMLAANGLPRLRHPLFDIREFDLATRNRFFLCLRLDVGASDAGAAADFLRAQRPLRTWEVPA
ncbi:MAG TPA: DUF3341 domain-containing protein [Rhodocyclaceae bacterium]